ncbi:connectin-like [Ochlerotatus camptorhynchus]|uniref:connectin-like n=1 Tax=Ochlerotatus camptorhynchus TaxID=644619 RepID=UPI0031DB4D19
MASTYYRHVTLVLLLLCIVTSPTESRYREKYPPKSKPAQLNQVPIRATMQMPLNLCSEDRNLKLLCNCIPEDPHVKAQTAKCWIFGEEIPRNDPDWLIFQTQITLETLKLTVQKGGNLSYIPSDVLMKLKHLKQLTIVYGTIENVPEYSFGNLTELRNLTLHKNQIRLVHPFAFANHPYLEEIHLQNNEIIELDKEALVNLPKLKRLNLDFNNLTILHGDMFAHLINLDELDLESNQVSLLTRESFKGLGNLKILKLSVNNIGYIGDTVFAELWSLKELHLDNNHIEKLSARAFDGLNNLYTLNLENNRLTRLERGIFTGVPAVLTLNLKSNQLETITYNNFLPLMDNLVNNTNVSLHVQDNRLVCDCRLLWLFDLRNSTKNKNLRNTLQQMECLYEPKDNRGLVPNSIQNQMSDFSRPHDILGYDDSTDYEDPLHHHHGSYGLQPPPVHRSSGVASSSSSSQQMNHHFPAPVNGYPPIQDHYDRSVGPPANQPLKTINGKQVVTLMKLRKEDFLPCVKDGPTELPLSRESIAVDPGSRSSVSASTDSGGPTLGRSLGSAAGVCLLAAMLTAAVC